MKLGDQSINQSVNHGALVLQQVVGSCTVIRLVVL